tara:strand:+ start:292 stop:396 length:105 start_codon:yes stop_codon:yes gene_type:complete
LIFAHLDDKFEVDEADPSFLIIDRDDEKDIDIEV